METTKNDLPPNAKKFFYNLSDYLDTKLLYFGSIQRADYVPGKSDIDVDIFTDNEKSIISKMQHFLGMPKCKFKRVVWIINDVTVHGYKLMYKNPEEKIRVEFSIYNEKFKSLVLKEHTKKILLPFYVTIFLKILKFFFYTFPILPHNVYKAGKDYLLTDALGYSPNKFVVLDEF